MTPPPPLARKVGAELVGTPFLVMAVVGTGPGLLLGEAIATLGLVAVISGALRTGRTSLVAYPVGGCITAAYWFTSSTSIANPAVTIARMFSDTFAGIAPSSVPMFLAIQIVGAALALALIWLLYPTPAQRPLLAAALEAP